MKKRIGIDIGGTFTDAVLLANLRIERAVKVPTHSEDLLQTILNALDTLKVENTFEVEQITVSTTLVTNAILQKKLSGVEICLFPGAGMSVDALAWPVSYNVLSGIIDYRGREIEPPNKDEWLSIVQKLQKEELRKVAIVGKFSHRNSLHEELLASYLQDKLPDIDIALGHHWGQANFYRRTLTTYLHLATTQLFEKYTRKLQEAVKARGFIAPLYVLKADGGVLPLDKTRSVESIYSGPAASVLGAMAQNTLDESFVVVDIGGTTTDIGIVLSGSPLLSAKGAKIGGFLTTVRSLAVRSVPVGGDTAIQASENGFTLMDYRLGPAYCLGGSVPTPTDAMCCLGLIDYGDQLKAQEGLAKLLPEGTQDPIKIKELSERIIEVMVDRIARQIESMEIEWQDEPAYKIWEVLHPHEMLRLNIWLSGGGGLGIRENLAQRLQTQVRLGTQPGVSNAIGAAMAKPTLTCTLHLDTFTRCYRIAETGEQGEWHGNRRPHQEVNGFLEEKALKMAEEKGIILEDFQIEPFDFFPVVHGYETVGQLVRGALYMAPGVRGKIQL